MVPQGGEGAVVRASLVVRLVAVLRGGGDHGEDGGDNELKSNIVSSGKSVLHKVCLLEKTFGIASNKSHSRRNE